MIALFPSPDLLAAQCAARQSGDWNRSDETWDQYLERKDEERRLVNEDIRREVEAHE
jgi:hypothetical protein